ncbi:MAG TPA: DUF485 domain-containing protein [Chthoniobacteraceae bacterium]|jgi:uncharacterized membrane protein (DUF485 family)
MSSPDPGDPTPEIASPTDIAPLGRSGTKPVHEQTAGEDSDPYDWDAIANDPAFHELKAAKRRFIIPGTIFFLIYYMTLPVLVGFLPELMKTPVWGKVNWAYLYALSQFLMTWIICALYVRAASRWDKMNATLLARFPRR